MTHETQGKRWPPTAGVEADYITVETNGCGALAAERLRLHGIPHTSVWVGATGRSARKPPTLEGWSFSVYNGSEEHASGWGSATLADMAPALLAAVGMSDAATANKRAQAAENLAGDTAGDRDGAVEALDRVNDTLGKLCVVLGGAGFTGDLLTGVQRLITQRDALADGCRDFAVKGVDAEETIAALRDERKDLRAVLKRDVIYALKRELSTAQSERDAAKHELAESQTQLRDISDVLGPRRGDEPVTAQAERARKILDCWHTLALKHLPDCPQLRRAGHGNAGFDLGTLHFELRGFMSGEISALRDRISLAAEREDLTIAALGHPCSTNGIPEAVRLLRRDAERWLTECAEVGARAAAYSAENMRLSTQRDDARNVLAIVRKALETPDGECLADHATKVYKNSERTDRMTEEVTRLNKTLENTGGYGAREAAKALRKENEYLSERVGKLRACWEAWQKWARGKLDINAVNATVSDDKLRTAIDAYYAEAVFDTRVPSDECRAAVDYLIAHPGRGLTAELAHEGAKTLRQRLENGLPYTHPLRYLIDMALSAGVNAAHEMWETEVQQRRDEAAKAYKRLDQWVVWGHRAACVHAAPDDALRSEIDKALPMWRRGTPEV